jgi:CheY-like chemotaxis protein
MSTPTAVRLTESGRRALRENRVSREHRRILSLVEVRGNTEVIRGLLRRYPDALLERWLAELSALGLVEATDTPPEPELKFTGAHGFSLPQRLEQDEKRLADEAWAASNLLSVAGAYVARERARNRASPAKAPDATTILIVEDDPDQRALAAQRLRAAGYRLREAESASALLQALKRPELPDLVLLDVMLPDGDGFDILASLRRHPRFSLLPIVMLTVKADPADVQAGVALGADGYVAKPYRPEVLLQAIAEVLP